MFKLQYTPESQFRLQKKYMQLQFGTCHEQKLELIKDITSERNIVNLRTERQVEEKGRLNGINFRPNERLTAK